MLSMGTGATEKDLFEIIRCQSEQIDGLIAENKALKAEIARLKKRIKELERRERKYAAPFSQEKRTADPKSPGRRPGEGTFAHKSPPTPEQITATVEVEMPNTCPRCGFTGPLIFTRQDKGLGHGSRPPERHAGHRVPRARHGVPAVSPRGAW